MMAGSIWAQVAQVHRPLSVKHRGVKDHTVIYHGQDGFVWAASGGSLFRLDGKRVERSGIS